MIFQESPFITLYSFLFIFLCVTERIRRKRVRTAYLAVSDGITIDHFMAGKLFIRVTFSRHPTGEHGGNR